MSGGLAPVQQQYIPMQRYKKLSVRDGQHVCEEISAMKLAVITRCAGIWVRICG